MTQSHLSSEEFFTQLASLLESRQKSGHGSVYLTQKRMSFDATSEPLSSTKIADDPLWDLHLPNPLPVIIRATDGKTQSKDRKKNKDKVKLCTVVQPDDLEAFYARYAEVCKAGMQSLKKRDRKKQKTKKKEKRKGAAGEDKK